MSLQEWEREEGCHVASLGVACVHLQIRRVAVLLFSCATDLKKCSGHAIKMPDLRKKVSRFLIRGVCTHEVLQSPCFH